MCVRTRRRTLVECERRRQVPVRLDLRLGRSSPARRQLHRRWRSKRTTVSLAFIGSEHEMTGPCQFGHRLPLYVISTRLNSPQVDSPAASATARRTRTRRPRSATSTVSIVRRPAARRLAFRRSIKMNRSRNNPVERVRVSAGPAVLTQQRVRTGAQGGLP